jgi:hypothetical protein
MIYRLKTFNDIISAVREEVNIQTQDALTTNKIKRDINIAYSDLASRHRWNWLRSYTSVNVPAYFGSTGTVSVTQNSVDVTLSSAPAYSVKGYFFSVNNTSEIYRVASHTAGATTLVLETAYTSPSSTTAAFRIWAGRVALPAECRETIEVTHQWMSQPLENTGLQEFRRISSVAPKHEGRPTTYTTTQKVDPAPYSSIIGLPALSTRASSGLVRTLVFASSVANYLSVGDLIQVTTSTDSNYNGEFTVSSVSTTTITYTAASVFNEAAIADASLTVLLRNSAVLEETYRELNFYPSLFSAATTLQVDYIREAPPLNNDSDEPLVPAEFRSVLLYGACHRAWSRERNPQEAARNLQLYENLITKMMGKLEDSVEYVQIGMDRKYLGTKRATNSGNSYYASNKGGGSGGGGGSSQIQGTANRVAIFGATGFLTPESAVGDLTVSAGLIGITPGVIVDADINSAAAIARSKFASGTGYRILANDATGAMSENAALTPGQLVIADANGQLSTTAALPGSFVSTNLVDNQASAATILTWALATYDSIVIQYSLKRGTANKETGQIQIATDGTNASIAVSGANIGTLGVTFSAAISGTDLVLQYTSTSTGTAPTFKYNLTQWLA